MSFEHLHGAAVSLVVLARTGRPDVAFAVFAAADDPTGVIAKRGVDLGAGIFITLELQLEGLVAEVVKADARVVAGDEEFDFTRWVIWRICDCLDASDFASLDVPTV